MTPLAARFTATVEVAMELDTPSTILRRILADPADNGLRAASHEARVSGGDRTSHPERMAERDHTADTRRHVDEMILLRRHAEAAVDAVDALLAICLDRGRGADEYAWGDALKDAHLMCEMGVVETALDVDHDRSTQRVVGSWCDAIDQLERLGRRWPKDTGRTPSSYERAWTSDLADEDCCRICLLVAPAGKVRVRSVRRRLCWTCYRLTELADAEPPVPLVEVWHDCDRKGQSVVWRNARARWLESVGVKAS